MSQALNVNIKPGLTVPVFNMSQYDVGRVLTVTLKGETGDWEIPSEATVTVQGTKPSGFGFRVSCTYSGSVVTITTTATMTEESGRFPVELSVEDETNGILLGSANFLFNIEKSPHLENVTDGDAVTAQTLEERIDELEDRVEDIEQGGGGGLTDLTDVNIASPTNGQVLTYDSASGKWVNRTGAEPTDEQVGDAVADWLDEHPEATTTVQDGSITEAKLAPEVVAQLGSTELTYKWNAIGYMRNHVREFQGWAQCVVFEPDLNCAVGIVTSGNSSHTYIEPWYRVTIDNSGYMSAYEKITVYDTDGVTEYTPTGWYMGSLCRMENGTYICIGNDHNIYTSDDYCQTLTRMQTYAFANSGSMFGLKQLSNGRLIVGYGGNYNGFYYSDDGGETWTATSANNNGLGQQVYPEGAFKPFEPCFIDCGNGKVLAIARKSNNAIATGTTAYTAQEPAVYSVSTDYGATWTAWENSSTITDMTANNAKAVIIDGIVHLVYGSRYTATDTNFKLFYTYAKLDDAYDDNWATPVVIDVGQWNASTATNPHDSGYPSIWKDENNNLYSVHYDSDGTGSAFGANWRLCTGAPVEKTQAVYNGGGGSYNVAYSQKAVDDKLSNLLSQINELWLAIGEIPDDTGTYDGTAPIYSGLVAWFDVTNINKWNSGVSTSMVGESVVAKSTNSAASGATIKAVTSNPTVYNNGFADTVKGLFVQHTMQEIVGDVNAFTIEMVNYIAGNSGIFFLKTSTTLNASNTNNPTVFSKNNNISGYKNGVRHVVGVFTSGSIDWYIDGAKTQTETTSVSFSDMLAAYSFFTATNASGAVGDVRIYSCALTADEIHNNYLYTKHETDYSVAPVFTTE